MGSRGVAVVEASLETVVLVSADSYLDKAIVSLKPDLISLQLSPRHLHFGKFVQLFRGLDRYLECYLGRCSLLCMSGRLVP